MVNILIIGGGWGGLSVAHQLVKRKNSKITLLDRNKFLGGQAASIKSLLCYVEYSWRVFFGGYKYVHKIVRDLNIKENFDYLGQVCISSDGDCIDMSKLNRKPISDIMKTFKLSKWDLLKLKWLISLPEWLLNTYSDTPFTEYFNQDPLFMLIAGPVLGQEPTKVSVPEVINTIRDIIKKNKSNLNNSKWQVTSGPPNESIFIPWKKFLKVKGVNFVLGPKGEVTQIKNSKGKWEVFTKNQKYIADKLIISSSLLSTIKLLHKYRKLNTIQNLTRLKPCLQTYLSINFYFTEKIKGLPKSFILMDRKWMPIIEVKKWSKYIKKCDKVIKSVWNVGVYDLVRGERCKKYLRNCTLDQAITEAIYQVRTDPLIKKMIPNFDRIFYKAEVFPYWSNKKGKIHTSNPKFSINAGCAQYLIDSIPKEPELQNLYFSAYYCKSDIGGVSMERSCRIGTILGKKI